MQLDKKQEAFLALSFGIILILVALILVVLFAGRSTLTCYRNVNGQNECVYKVQSVFNSEIKRFKVSELMGGESICKNTRSASSNSSSCFVVIKTASEQGDFSMKYGIHKDQSGLIPIANRINGFVKDIKTQQLNVSQEGWIIISIVSGVLSFFGVFLVVFAAIYFRKLS